MTEAIATDWLVSITPTARGDFQTPGGIRYNVTYHNGASAVMLEALIAELDASADLLVPAVATQAVSMPPASAQVNAPANSDGLPTQNIFGVGDVPIGSRFTHSIERIVMGSTTSGNTKGDIYPVGAKYPLASVFAGKDGANFAAIKQATNADLTTATGAVEFDPPVLMVFEVSTKQKQNSENYYINWVGMASDNQQDAAPASDNGGSNWALDAESRDKFVSWAELHHGLSVTLLMDCFSVKDLSAITCDKPEAMRKVAAYARQLAQQQDEESADIPF